MHTKINEWKIADDVAINEAIKANPIKSLNTVKANFEALRASTSALHSTLVEMSNTDDVLINKYATEAIHELKGSFYYVLTGDLAKYLRWLEEKVNKMGTKIKKRKISIQLPQDIGITTEQINELVYAIDIEYTSKVIDMSYRIGDGYTMASYSNSDGSSGLTILSKSRYTSILRAIGNYCKRNEALRTKFLALLSKKTGYNFTFQYDVIYIKK